MKTLSEFEFQEELKKAMAVAQNRRNKMAFSVCITANNLCGIGCRTSWGNDLSDEELVSAFVSWLDDIRQDSHKAFLFGKALGVSDEMRNDGIDSYTFAERKEE